jgi:hypothetical protein
MEKTSSRDGGSGVSYTRTTSKPEERFDIGYVLWEDANGRVDGASVHEPHHAALPLLSAGVIVKNDEKGVTLSMDFSCEGSFREIRFIPRVNVVEVKVLKRGAVARSPQYAVFPKVTPQKKGKRAS